MRLFVIFIVFVGMMQTASAQMVDVENAPSCELNSFLKNLEPAVAEQEFAGEACMADEATPNTPTPFTAPDPTAVKGDWSGPCGSSADCIIKSLKNQDSETEATPESR